MRLFPHRSWVSCLRTNLSRAHDHPFTGTSAEFRSRAQFTGRGPFDNVAYMVFTDEMIYGMCRSFYNIYVCVQGTKLRALRAASEINHSSSISLYSFLHCFFYDIDFHSRTNTYMQTLIGSETQKPNMKGEYQTKYYT